MSKFIPTIVIVFFGFLEFFGISKSLAEVKRSSVLRVRLNSEPTTFDWNQIREPLATRLVSQTMEGLVDANADQVPVPALAKSWNISSDRKTYTFHLRKGVKWTDGVELSAQQFVDSWLRLLNPKNAARGAESLFDVVGAIDFGKGRLTDPSKVGVRALDRYTLEVRLARPVSYFLGVLDFPALSPIRLDLIEKHGTKWTEPEHLATLGPYKLAEWKHGVKIVLAKNDRYYGVNSGPQTIEFILVHEDSTAVNLFEAKQLDFVPGLPPSDLDRLKRLKSFHVEPMFRSYGYRFNVKVKPFDDVRVRRALAYAVEKKQFERLFSGAHSALSGWVPQGIPGYSSKAGLPFDPERARNLLAQAGYPGGKNFPKVTAYYDSADMNRLIAERLQAVWKEILGVEIEFKAQDFAAHVTMTRVNPPALFKIAYSLSYIDPYDTLIHEGPDNGRSAGWESAEFTRLLKNGSEEVGAEARRKIYEEAERLLVENDAVVLPIIQENTQYLLSDKVKKIGFFKGMYLLKETELSE